MRAATLSDTSNSGTILGVGTPGFSTGARSKSTTSSWNSRSQRELTVNQLSGKLGADHGAPAGQSPAGESLPDGAPAGPAAPSPPGHPSSGSGSSSPSSSSGSSPTGEANRS